MRGKLSSSINLKVPVDDKTGLKLEDFVIVLQAPMQAEIMLKIFFEEGKVVCVDATHGTNAYNFSVVTLLVVDEKAFQ